MRKVMAELNSSIFAIQIDFEKGTPNPSRVFRSMTDLIDAFEQLDKDLVASIDMEIETVLTIEDVETGSIKSWLRNKVELINDEALMNLDWKPLIGQFLVKGKKIVLRHLEEKTEITSVEEVKEIESQLYELAKSTNVRKIPTYEPINRRQLLKGIESISKSLEYLNENDIAKYVTSEDETKFNPEFDFIPESIEELITQQQIISTQEMILKVKKPDYLGESQWELRHENRAINAKILHTEWLDKFQERKIDIRPGDSLRATVKIIVNYGYDSEVVSTKYEIENVKGIIKAEMDNQLSIEYDKDE